MTTKSTPRTRGNQCKQGKRTWSAARWEAERYRQHNAKAAKLIAARSANPPPFETILRDAERRLKRGTVPRMVGKTHVGPCLHCGRDVDTPDELCRMLTEPVWVKACGPLELAGQLPPHSSNENYSAYFSTTLGVRRARWPYHELMHLACVEERLGRKLTDEDFNQVDRWPDDRIRWLVPPLGPKAKRSRQ